ncbi:chorismate synthase [Candidatus Kapaibacterium sp.]
MNSFGRIFRVHIFGESHGECVGILIDGCPPGLSLSENDFKEPLIKRNPKIKGTTPRKEKDEILLKTGIFNGFTTGAPILIEVPNKNINSKDYDFVKSTPRPGHADFVASQKYYGFNDYRGGGHFSGRLTTSLVIAGVIAKKIIPKIVIESRLISVGGSDEIEKTIDNALKYGDSVGGIVECTAKNVPLGLGEPFFDSLESLISHMVFSIPAIKGIEFGSGFNSACMNGSEHNDLIIDKSGKTATNNSGGINGGISNGNDLVFRVAVKPSSSISVTQSTLNFETNEKQNLKIIGRHDICIALRVPVVLESVLSIVLADLNLIRYKK